MSIPTPEERPDLYDEGYDGLPDGRKSSIEVQEPDWMARMKQGEKAAPLPGKMEP